MTATHPGFTYGYVHKDKAINIIESLYHNCEGPREAFGTMVLALRLLQDLITELEGTEPIPSEQLGDEVKFSLISLQADSGTKQ